MRTRLMTATIATMSIAGALTLSAQSQTPQPAANPSQAVTITGCVQPEAAVPGMKPNPVERTGVTEDYILTNVKMAPSSKVAGMGLSTKYEIEGIAGSELKKHINHQVELTGTIAADRKANDESPDFNATSIKMISATCPPADQQ